MISTPEILVVVEEGIQKILILEDDFPTEYEEDFPESGLQR